MSKVSLYIAASLDGYIARPDGDIKWLEEFPNPAKEDFGYHDFLKSIDITVMGGTTYRQVLSFGEWPYPDQENYVITRQAGPEDPNVTFIRNINDFLKGLRERSTGKIWLIGGGEINSIFLQNDLIDELILTIVPLVLGDGIPLFAKGNFNKRFKLENAETFTNGMVQLTYSKI